MARFVIVCEGTAPLLMHNARLVDPLDSVVKQIRAVSSKTKKTDEDHAEIAHLEWLGGIYYQRRGTVHPRTEPAEMPGRGARLSKDGKKIERGVFIETMMIPVEYDGPRDLQNLYGDHRFVHRAPVKVGMARVMRTRPLFTRWKLTATGMYDAP